MIKVRDSKVLFTGKDAKNLAQWSKKSGLSQQEFFTGLLWEYVMREARKGAFLKKKGAN